MVMATRSTYEMVIIGGGINGAGVAQAAAAAGHRVLLLEKSAPAAGTSSRSSKLIHGGLRYLEHARFGLVREALTERRRLLLNAPNLVHTIPFFIPVYKKSSRRPLLIRLGLLLYALLGGLTKDTRFTTIRRKDWDKELLGINQNGLRAVFRYADAQTDDAALTKAVLMSAVSFGAEVIYPAEMQAAVADESGYTVTYQTRDATHYAHCRTLVNAAGPWINTVQALISPAVPRKEIDLIAGTHIILNQQPSKGVFYVEAPTDRRPVLIMPWGNNTLVGTTETLFTGDPDTIAPTEEEKTYLLNTYRAYFPKSDADITDAFAGIRVLPKSEESFAKRSRETILLPNKASRPTYVAIYGGKLTTYRATAEKVMRLLRSSLPAQWRQGDTRTLRLP